MAVPGLVNGSQVLCSLLDQGKHDETEELIGDARFDNVFNAHDEKDCQHCHNGERQSDGYDAFCESELRFCDILVMIQIGMLIGFKNFVEDGMLRAGIVENEAAAISMDIIA